MVPGRIVRAVTYSSCLRLANPNRERINNKNIRARWKQVWVYACLYDADGQSGLGREDVLSGNVVRETRRGLFAFGCWSSVDRGGSTLSTFRNLACRHRFSGCH